LTNLAGNAFVRQIFQVSHPTHLLMYHPRPLAVCVCTLVSLMAGTAAKAVFIDFDTSGVLASDFNIAISSDAGKLNGVAESATGGISGSAGSLSYTANTNNDSTVFYKGTSFDFTADGTVLTESMMFLTGAGSTTANARSIQLGFGTKVDSPFNGGPQQGAGLNLSAWTSVRVNTTGTSGNYTFEGQDKPSGNVGANAAFNNTAISLTANTWYQLSIVLTNQAGAAGSYTISGSLQSFGLDGLTPGAVVSSFTSATRTVAIDAALFGGFRTAAGNNNVTNYDSYSVVPEPSAFGAIGGGVALLGLLRRRR